MTEYIDPNSGRAAQPGGYASAMALPEENAPEENVEQSQDAEVNPSVEEQQDEQAPEQEGEPSESSEPAAEEAEAAKDYSELLSQNVQKIQKYMDSHPDEADAVKTAEIDRAGDDARKGVIEYGD